MCSYLISKLPSKINVGWINWSAKDFKNLDPESNQIATLVFVTQKLNICTIYKPTPIKNDDGSLSGIIGNMLDEKSTPEFIKIDGKEVGSCCVIHYLDNLPPTHRPEMPLSADILKDTIWKEAKKELALWMIPTLAPVPFGKRIKSTIFDDSFVNQMEKMSEEHGFWARMMNLILKQSNTESYVTTIVKRMIDAKTFTLCDPCRAATKGFCKAYIPSSVPFIKISFVGCRHETKQAILRTYFERNPTPAQVEVDDDNKDVVFVQVQQSAEINKASTNANATTTAHATATTAAPQPSLVKDQQQEFYKQMVETMRIIQDNAPSKQQKIAVESKDHKETIDAAKLQMSMLKLMYAFAVLDWDEGTVKSVRLALFTQEYKNLFERLATVQVTQLSNLIKMVFSTKPDDEDDDGPLNRLMLMYVIPPKFTKGHVNATFQSDELEFAAIYKSSSINPFNYAPQTNHASVLAEKKEFDLKQNEKSFSVSKTHCKKVSSHIKGIGKNQHDGRCPNDLR
jgi:hypothetical protein